MDVKQRQGRSAFRYRWSVNIKAIDLRLNRLAHSPAVSDHLHPLPEIVIVGSWIRVVLVQCTYAFGAYGEVLENGLEARSPSESSMRHASLLTVVMRMRLRVEPHVQGEVASSGWVSIF